jgi:hypothetical protein
MTSTFPKWRHTATRDVSDNSEKMSCARPDQKGYLEVNKQAKLIQGSYEWLIVAEAREQASELGDSELKLGVHKNTSGQVVKIWSVTCRLYVTCSTVILEGRDSVRLA